MVPALAVAGALQADGAEVAWVGGERAEASLVPEAGIRFLPVRVSGLSRSNPLKAARAVLQAFGAVAAAWRILGRERPDAVLGGGGYVAGPVGLAAVLRRVPLVLTEADSHLGLTNRLLARFARRVCLAFPIDGRDEPRFRVTGRPVPAPSTDRAAARLRFGIPDDAVCVLVFGGSLGARTINDAAVAGLADAGCWVLHASGHRDFDELRARLGAPPRYVLEPYIQPFGDALVASDLVVARSGGSIFEIAAHGRPALLVPYPHAAADHQTANARWMVDSGAAVVVTDAELSGARLRSEVDRLLAEPARLAAMASASAGLARVDAAREIAREVLSAAGRGG
ncbi:UDP-N-acetylglucosamine--N-acetylmuramyl-(pentapeptide) pyrophosphoryl-undecaprenol N-acetylglucosamine transferase [Capillimicrobium parvum]|uniref:UDP-N-acetylglucosamine--N-acetylmuramyl-(pentapeptide) pyrophosphoryl-undecaprenol N-acetylglucosamine transferase n=1 Tax=Capillimicrobium parvum TaxID=2884022 RepID=A0A9E6XWM9_9ACTN|nr:UDP-N-acetylglucosamine--N-acetylmuramyl-(pentapeptide) pyrophosphoryl-undecaprenol N-acetylglucosamine transferase [Capillimicrobium parvum]